MVLDHGHSDSVPVGPISKIPQACREKGPAVPDLERSADNQAGQTIHQLTFPYISAHMCARYEVLVITNVGLWLRRSRLNTS